MPDTAPVLTINSINIEGEDYQLEDTVARARADALALSIYEVGDLFFSKNPTSPAERFGGEWEQLEDVFIRAANDTETGGSDTVTLTVSQLPSHSHTMTLNSNGNLAVGNKTGLPPSGGTTWAGYVGIVGNDIQPRLNTMNAGLNGEHNNMPAYQNVYVWERVA